MNLLRRAITDTPSGVAIADTPADLQSFLQPGSAATVWRRQTPPHFQKWLDALDPERLPKGRVVLQPSAVAQTLTHLCEMSKLPCGPERDWLIADIADLADVFAELMQARFLRLRLDVVTTNACRKFHIDAITARLVCTYRGPGTQYGMPGKDAEPNRIFTMNAGAPILLRGKLWPTQPSMGLVHRSPPIEGTGKSRLVLVLDPVNDPEDDL